MAPPVRPSLTRIQRKVLTRLAVYIRKHRYAPTYRELMALCEFAHVRSVAFHLAAIEKKGYIVREPGKSRAIEIVGR